MQTQGERERGGRERGVREGRGEGSWILGSISVVVESESQGGEFRVHPSCFFGIVIVIVLNTRCFV